MSIIDPCSFRQRKITQMSSLNCNSYRELYFSERGGGVNDCVGE